MNKDLKSPDNLAICADDPDGGPLWMCNYSREWFRLEPLKRMIIRTILKALTNQINKQPINQINQPIEPTIDRSRLTNQIIENDGLARPATLAKAETNQNAIDQIITIIANIAHRIRWGLELATSLDQELEVWNRLGVWSQPRKLLRFRRFKRLM